MKRGEMIRTLMNMAWGALPDKEANAMLDHYKLSEKDIVEFLSVGEIAINDIDEMFASKKPV